MIHPQHPLAQIEPRLRNLVPAALYADAWLDPSQGNLVRVFEHLRTLQRILRDYLPRMVSESPPQPGDIRKDWRTGALMFTDLAGFTPLMEAYAALGEDGARTLLDVLNQYFATMLEIISKSGGNLLEFSGDALLAEFPIDARTDGAARAVRAGLRMQIAMRAFREIETEQGQLSLGMRVGVHTGGFLQADVGTPRRMAHVLLGNSVLRAKQAEGAGAVGRVCLTDTAYERVASQFEFERGKPGHWFVCDGADSEALGEYEIAPKRRRNPGVLLLDRSSEGLIQAVTEAVQSVEPLASFIPRSIFELLVERAAQREVRPEFPTVSVLFVNLIGLPESVDRASASGIERVVSSFSRIFALIHGAVVSHGGTLKNVTYHLNGSDIVCYFGAPVAHADDSIRAAHAAVDIRRIVRDFEPPIVNGAQLEIACQIGITCGKAFAAEIGEPRGRREFNVLGDVVNTSARLMNLATGNRIFVSAAVYEDIQGVLPCKPLGELRLKGKVKSLPAWEIVDPTSPP